MESGLAGVFPGHPQHTVRVEEMPPFEVTEHFRPGRRGFVPILQVHPVLLGLMKGRIETQVPVRTVTVARTTHKKPLPGAHSILDTSPVDHLLWAHFWQVLALKELSADVTSIGACLLGTPRYVVWAFRDRKHGAWVISCCLDGFCFEVCPGDQFALYQS